jgi:replicative DNA helicase
MDGNELTRNAKFKDRTKNQSPILHTVPSGGKLPPQALEIERAVLGALMLEKDALSKVIDALKPEIFYKPAHQEIFKAILSLFQDSEPIDILTVTQQLRRMAVGALEACGGPAYISDLTSQVASAANIEYHAHIIKQAFIQRELIQLCSKVEKEAYEDTKDVFDLLDETEQKLYQLSSDNLRKESQSIEQIAYATIKQLEALRLKGDGVTGITSGFKRLDELTAGWQKSDLVIIAARPAMGKTAFVLSVARNASVIDKKPVALFSLEMSATQLVQRLLCSEAELDAQRVRTGRLEDFEWQQLNSRIGNLSKAPLYIDDTPGLSIYDLRAKCRRLKAERGIEMVIIDYLQLMEGEKTRSGNREQEISGISRALKKLAKELNIPVIALSQLSRAVETRSGQQHRPMLSDLRESGAIEQDADMVIFLYRPEYYGLETTEDGQSTAGLCEVIIGKQRNGPTDTAKLQFISRFGKFTDFEGESGFAFRSEGNSYGNSASISKLTKSSAIDKADDSDLNIDFSKYKHLKDNDAADDMPKFKPRTDYAPPEDMPF